ncbi:MAG: lysylphosphatidylglycerol synthase transmembrane domain-containing protein [Kiritimatiellae bacterium]|nr:lysylphosphatidylglycerol synthase transmembrane domain-containing protein [Kiritimatiellia bacterium]
MKRWIPILKVAVSLGFIGLLVATVDMGELLARARDVDIGYLLLCVVISFLMVAASTWKWWYLLRQQGHPVPFLRMYRWYFIGYFYSNFLPSNVGGDVMRAWLAGRYCGSGSAALISIFAERFTGSLMLLVLALGMPFVGGRLWRHPAVWPVMVLALILLAGAIGLLVGGHAAARSAWLARLAAQVRRWVHADRPGRIAWLWERGSGKVQALGAKAGHLRDVFWRDPRVAGVVLAQTLLFYALTVANVLLGYRAFGAWPMVGGIAAVLPIAMLVGMIPITLGNLGIAEGAYVVYFGLVGMGKELTLAMGLLLRLKIIMLGFVGMVAQMTLPAGTLPHEPESPDPEAAQTDSPPGNVHS